MRKPWFKTCKSGAIDIIPNYALRFMVCGRKICISTILAEREASLCRTEFHLSSTIYGIFEGGLVGFIQQDACCKIALLKMNI